MKWMFFIWSMDGWRWKVLLENLQLFWHNCVFLITSYPYLFIRLSPDLLLLSKRLFASIFRIYVLNHRELHRTQVKAPAAAVRTAVAAASGLGRGCGLQVTFVSEFCLQMLFSYCLILNNHSAMAKGRGNDQEHSLLFSVLDWCTSTRPASKTFAVGSCILFLNPAECLISLTQSLSQN